MGVGVISGKWKCNGNEHAERDCRARAREALEPRRRQHAQFDLAHARA